MAGWDRNKNDQFDEKFEKVYQENIDRVYRYIYSIVLHEITAEDLTAEVFITVWKKRNILLQYENVEGLLHKIGRDLSFNYLRSLAKDRKKKEEYFRHYFELYSANDEYILREIQLSALEHAIDQLPEKCREVVKMKFMHSKSLKEIASELHISVNTVQNHLTKGKFIIKELLKTDDAYLILVVVLSGII